MEASPDSIAVLIEQLKALDVPQGASPPRQPPPLPPGPSRGTPAPMDGEWKISVEKRLTDLHNDLRALLNRGIIAVVGLAGMIAGLYLYNNQKFEKLADRLTAIEVQQAKTDAAVNGKLDLLVERLSKK